MTSFQAGEVLTAADLNEAFNQGTAGLIVELDEDLELDVFVDATASVKLADINTNLLCLQVTAATEGVPNNYVLELYDGDPDDDGVLLYQASGITADSYTDNAPFFVSSPESGEFWAKATNVDSDATTIHLAVRYMALSS